MWRTRIQLSISILAAALMLQAHQCGAQSSNACPVEIRHAKFQTVVLGPWAHNLRTKVISLQYMNATGEEMQEVVFNASTNYREHGAMGQSLVDNTNKTPITATVAPGKWKKGQIDLGASEFRQMQLTLSEVTFSSGRRWQNSSPDQCVWTVQP